MRLDKFIKRPVLSTVISILIVVLGIIGLISLPIEQYPDIAPPTIRVSAHYSGADAETVLNSVVAPLEEQINGVENMTYMTSTATNDGSASITVYFKQGSNPDMASVNVQNRVTQAQALLPAEVIAAGVTTEKRQSSMLMIYSLTSDDGQYDEKFLTNYLAINVTPAVQRVEGVGNVQSFGAKTYSMRIWLDPDAMRQHHLIPGDITGVLAEQNIEAAPGKFGNNSDRTHEYIMRYSGRLKTAEEFGNMIISSDKNGNTLRLKDVAKVELGGLSYLLNGRSNNQPAVPCMVTQIAGSNANDVVKGVKETLKEQEKNFPKGMKIVIAQDATEFLYASINKVLETLLEAFILVFFVVYIFLQNFRSTLVPAIAIPVSLIGTFFFLKLFGFSINLLTLSALVLVIAIVVDDAIVVVEAVHAKLDLGYKSAKTASIDAMNEISGAIISITLVMASVFIPVSFIGGTSGTFYKEFGITMAIAIMISALNALTLSPALCALFLKPHNKEENKKNSFINRWHTAFNTTYETILGKYKNHISFFIRHKVTSFIIVIIGIAAMAILMFTTRTGLVPDEDTGTLFATISMTPGSSLDKTQKMMNQIDDMLQTNPAIKTTTQITGYSFIAGQGSNFGTFIIKLKDFEERGDGESSTDVLKTFYAQTSTLKDVQILAFAPPMIPGFSASNGLTFSMQDKTGGSVDKFFNITQQFLGKLNQRPEISYAMTSYNPSYPQYMIDVDVAKCKQSGISPATILTTLQGYYGGLYSSNFNRFGKLYRVMVQGDPQKRLDKNSLKSIYVRTGTTMAPVEEFININKVYGPSTINRFNLFTSIDINAAPAAGYSTGNAINAVNEVAAQILPSGYGYDFSGLTRSEKESSNNTPVIFALCLLFVYLILSAQYESYILPLAVILSIPFGLGGSFLFIKMFGLENNIYMQISLIMLIGLLAKNAILIIQFALERRELGMSITWSGILGASSRLRPILMTSFALIIGLLPLMFASGVGANGNKTLGASAVGGMLIGMICQIFIVPALYVIFQKLQEKFKPMTFEEGHHAKINVELLQYTKSNEQKNNK
ncbi:MAG: efflux RND transporter permease subunit [Prolixibacteraceae bacterium]|nr:efflux RND transporter permease subunit [Prolixibacteraceae bacterium]